MRFVVYILMPLIIGLLTGVGLVFAGIPPEGSMLLGMGVWILCTFIAALANDIVNTVNGAALVNDPDNDQ